MGERKRRKKRKKKSYLLHKPPSRQLSHAVSRLSFLACSVTSIHLGTIPFVTRPHPHSNSQWYVPPAIRSFIFHSHRHCSPLIINMRIFSVFTIGLLPSTT